MSKTIVDETDGLINSHAPYGFIFSGIVSNNRSELCQIETFHKRLSKMLSMSRNLKKVVLISSSSVYGTYKNEFSELDDCKPVSCYGLSKLRIEKLYQENMRDRLTIFRLGNVVGLDAVGKAICNSKTNSVLIDADTNGSIAERSFVDDKILVDSLNLVKSGYCENIKVLNIGRYQPQKMSEIAEELGVKVIIRKGEMKVQNISLNTKLLQSLLSKPSVNIRNSSSQS